MELKTKPTNAHVELKKKGSTSFVRDLKEELKKISWTTKQELIFCTKIAVWSTIIFGLGIYFADLLIKNILEMIKYSLHFIFG